MFSAAAFYVSDRTTVGTVGVVGVSALILRP